VRVEHLRIQSHESPAQHIPFTRMVVGQFYEYQTNGYDKKTPSFAVRETSGHMTYFSDNEMWRSMNPVIEGVLENARAVHVTMTSSPA
jgi:hypothetical protein